MNNMLDVENIAKKFWQEFVKHELKLYNYIISNNREMDDIAMSIIDKIKHELAIENRIGTYFRLGIRNYMKLKERQSCIEFIISPLFQKSNKLLLNALYKEYLNINLSDNWSVIKYKFHQPKLIYDMALTYDNVEVTKNDFKYHPIINKQKTLSVLLFINDDKACHLIKKETINKHDIWIPKGNGIHSMLDCAIGEYNLINILDKIEIHLFSDLLKKTFKDLQIYNLVNLMNDIDMLQNNSISNTLKCARCGYTSNQLKLYVCKCKKVHYCDSICQKAHRKLHLLGTCE